MKAVQVKLGDREYSLVYNGYAMFELEELCGGASALFEELDKGGIEGFRLLCRAFALLSRQGELCRRRLGYTPSDAADADALEELIMPLDIPRVKQAVYAAVLSGYGREVEPEEDTDLVLAELAQKKRTKSQKPNI